MSSRLFAPRSLSAAVCSVTLSSIAALGGCTVPDTSGNTNVACRELTPIEPTRPAAFTGTVFTIVLENKSYGDIFGSSSAPYLNELARTNAIAAGYRDSYVHPSEPNYIWMVAGENFGILNDHDPNSKNVIESESHLVDQIEGAGMTWKSYQESMGGTCGVKSHGTYAVKHNPFMYFADINGWNGRAFVATDRCKEHVVDYTQLDADLAAGEVPDYVFITPNLQHDMHDGSVAKGDAWLAAQVPKILASDAFKNGGVLFILFDEGSSQDDDPPFMAISPNAKPGFVSHTPYDTSSFLKTVQAILGLEALPCSEQPDAVSTMDDLFTASLTDP